MDDRHLIDCVHFRSGRCTANACPYRHAEIAIEVPCRYWLQYLCVNPRCKFLHPGEPTSSSAAVSLPTASATATVVASSSSSSSSSTAAAAVVAPSKATPLCRFFGRCKREGCKFLHELPAASLSRHPSAEDPEIRQDDNKSAEASGIDNNGVADGTTSSTISKKRDRESGSNILQRYSVTAIAASMTTHKKLKPVQLDIHPAAITGSTDADDYLSLA